MGSITKFLPKETQEKIRRDEQRFEQSFNLPTGTVQETSKSSRIGSSSISRTRPEPKRTSPDKPIIIKQMSAPPSDVRPPPRTIQTQISESTSPRREATGVIRGANPLTFYGSAPVRTKFFPTLRESGRKFIRGDFSGALQTLEQTERSKGDTRVPEFRPRTGTVQIDPLTGMERPRFETLRDKELKKEEDRQLKVMLERTRAEREEAQAFQTAQSKIDRGEDPVKAEQDYLDKVAKINKRYSQVQEERDPFDSSIIERTGTTKKVLRGIETGAVIGASAINPALGVGYLTGKGIVQIAKPTKREEIIAEGGLFGSVRRTDKGFEEASPLFTRELSKRQEGAISLGLAGVSAPSMVFRSGRGLLKSELEQLGKARTKFAEANILTGEGRGTTVIKGVQRSGQLRRESTILGGFETGSDKVLVSSGRGEAVVSGQFQSQLPIGFSSGAGKKFVASKEIFDVGFKGSSVPVKDLTFGFGKGVVTPKAQAGSIFDVTQGKVRPIQFFSSGRGKSEVGFFGQLGGRVSKEPETLKSSGGELLFAPKTRTATGIKFDSFGTTVNVQAPSMTGGVRSFQGGGAKSSPEFFSGLGSQGTVQQTTQKLSSGLGQLTKTSQTIIPVQRTATPTSSIFSGTGQYEQTITQQVLRRGVVSRTLAPLRQSDLLGGRFVSPSVRSGVRSVTRTAPATRTNVITGQAIGQRSDTLLGQGFRQPTRTVTQQIVTQQPLQTSTVRSLFGRPLPRGGVGVFGFARPQMAQLGRGFGKRLQTGKQLTRYQPSFTASALGITAKARPILAGGLSIRPVIRRK